MKFTRLLQEIGYSDIRIDDHAIEMTYRYDRQCPSNQPLAIHRNIEMRWIDISKTSEVSFLFYRDKKPVYSFLLRSLPSYRRHTSATEDFYELIDQKFGRDDWAHVYDKSFGELQKLIQENMPDFKDPHWFVFEMCHGDLPTVGFSNVFTFEDQSTLEALRLEIMQYYGN